MIISKTGDNYLAIINCGEIKATITKADIRVELITKADPNTGLLVSDTIRLPKLKKHHLKEVGEALIELSEKGNQHGGTHE